MFPSISRALQQYLNVRHFSRTTSLQNAVFKQFFDEEGNIGKADLRPASRPGRSWSTDELRLKSSEDLHKLWYVCIKERNMLLTMQKAYVSRGRHLPNPERIYRVKETMDRIEEVIHERNDAYFKLETGDGADPPLRTVTSFMGFTYQKPAQEHYSPNDNKEYEIPYLDNDSYMMQKLWKEKEYMKASDRKDDNVRREILTEKMKRFRRGGPRTFNRLEDISVYN